MTFSTLIRSMVDRNTKPNVLNEEVDMSSTPVHDAVRAIGISKRYGTGNAQVQALNNVSIRVQSGTFVAVMGPSGSGKSTLMQTLAGLDAIDSGEIWLDNTPINQLSDNNLTLLRRDRVGFIFQAFNLLPMLTAEQNIVLPLTIAKRTVDPAWFDTVVNGLGLRDRLDHKPGELSGGQQQRVAIARALITKPAVIFADEPTGNLDSSSSTTILNMLRQSVDHLRQTVIMVTHDPKAATYADQVVLLADGMIRQVLNRPSSEQLLAAFAHLESRSPATSTTGAPGSGTSTPHQSTQGVPSQGVSAPGHPDQRQPSPRTPPQHGQPRGVPTQGTPSQDSPSQGQSGHGFPPRPQHQGAPTPQPPAQGTPPQGMSPQG